MTDPSNKNAKLVPVLDGTLERRLIGLSGMAWATTVLQKTGLTASMANQIFSYRLPQSKAPKTLFHQYLRGERAPRQGIRGQYSYDMVTEVEQYMRSNEATDWLNHRLWIIFSAAPDPVFVKDFCVYADDRRPGIVQANLTRDPPTDFAAIKGTENEPQIRSFDDYIYQCALFRLASLGDMPVTACYWQIHYLADKAAELNSTFAFIKVPFLKMVADFFGEPIPEDPYFRHELILTESDVIVRSKRSGHSFSILTNCYPILF